MSSVHADQDLLPAAARPGRQSWQHVHRSLVGAAGLLEGHQNCITVLQETLVFYDMIN